MTDAHHRHNYPLSSPKALHSYPPLPISRDTFYFFLHSNLSDSTSTQSLFASGHIYLFSVYIKLCKPSVHTSVTQPVYLSLLYIGPPGPDIVLQIIIIIINVWSMCVFCQKPYLICFSRRLVVSSSDRLSLALRNLAF